MGSDRLNGRDGRTNRGASDPRRRRIGTPWAELLEERTLLSAWIATDSDIYDSENGPMANLGSTLVSLFHQYNNYLSQGSKGNFTTPLSSSVKVNGTNVGVDVRGTGNFTTFQQSLTALGMTIVSSSAVNKTVEGVIPIANLYRLATSAQINGASVVYKPTLNYQGIGNNESDQSLQANTARTNYGVNGAGQKIGVLSDSVNEYPNFDLNAAPAANTYGLGQSISTGDLPSNVNVLQDLPSVLDPTTNQQQYVGSDEGRAMLEQIYDIAPGAQLSFATAEADGQLAFADNIRALAAIGDKTIVDDVTYSDEAAFQDGFVTNAVNQVTAQGVTYLSSASNNGDSGYLSSFRGVNATVAGTTGRFMNFDPTGSTTTTTLGVQLDSDTGALFLQFDQPLNNVTSNVQLQLLDSTGNIVATSVTNPFATNQAFVALTGANGFIPAGTYKVAVQILTGADPGHIFIYPSGDSNVSFDHSFGSAGGTYYSATFGHNAAANAIGVAAVPFWGTAPFQTGEVYNEPYSSFGPVLREFNFDGSSATPTLLLKPDISAPDANNTSFFIPGQILDTSVDQIPLYTVYPGNSPTTFLTPKTPTNDLQNLPDFTGTSSAAPNLAAVVVLMKQVNPTVTNAQILAALKATATPVDNVAKGTWSPQGGYGLANAVAAIQQIAALQINSISPGSAATITAAPTAITVNFSKPVNIATLSAGSIVVTGPNGATVTVGAPIGVDSSTFPTIVQFPIVIHPAPGKVANGVYTVRIPAGTIKGQDGTVLQNTFTDTFNLQQTVQPTVTATTFNGRSATITFSGPVVQGTLTRADLFLIRAGGVNQPSFQTSAAVIVTNLINPATGTYYVNYSYNASTYTVTLDLSALPQALLPTDKYALIASNAITDLVGNPLNGQFSGVFPSGVTPQVAAGTEFSQILGTIPVTAPIISSLVLSPGSDSGIAGDNDTNVNRPSFIGQVAASFPSTNAGLTVYAQFNGIVHPGLATGGLNLGIGANGRGYVGTFDVQTTTNANGVFTINYPTGVSALPEGQNIIRVVVVGGADSPPAAGLSATFSTTFQVDRTSPYVAGTYLGTPATATQLTANESLNSLTSLMIAVVDPVNPTSTSSPFAVNPQTNVSALNPSTADNLSNYRLTQVVNGVSTDRTSFLKNAVFVSTSNRVLSSDPFLGRVDLTFGTGLPQGTYTLTIIPSGVTDAVGNGLTDNATDSSTGTVTPYSITFTLQPTPVYITNYGAFTVSSTLAPIDGVITGPRANYEVSPNGTTAGAAPLPPNAFYLDFSNQLSAQSAAVLASEVIIARSADSTTAKPDGDFGNFGTAAGLASPSGFTEVSTADITVRLMNSVANAVAGQPGYQNRLVITVPASDTNVPDYYRIWLPNTGTRSITDIYGNQLDGEFQGYQNAAGKYVDQLDTGVIRGSAAGDLPDMSGDGVAGGAFVTGFVVVPNGNVIYARPDALYNPQLPATYPDGSAAKPYPVLAPEATFTSLNNGDLNSSINAGVNFNSEYDRAGIGSFQPSAFFAAQELTRLTQAPVVIIAEPALLTRDPLTGTVTQRPFVLQAPAGSNPVANDGSAAIPAMTTLIFTAGSTLKMQNAALLVQNQGSALQITGGPNPSQIVNVTSYKDSTIGGATNGDPNSIPQSGDYGGILFRNYREAGTGANNSIDARASLFPGQIQTTGNISQDDRLKGPFANTTSRTSQSDAISGADPVMSYVNFLVEKYAGGSVPQTSGVAYDGITLQNSRPTIINTTIAFAGNGSGTAAAQAGLSEDYDSLLQDDVAAGPLFRNLTLQNNGINGIYLRARAVTGVTQATNATNIGTNDTTIGGAHNYVLNAYIPYVLTSNLVVGYSNLVETQGQTQYTTDRLYVTPGVIVKFNAGSGVEVVPSASINVGDQTYIKEFDANNSFGPSTSGFKANSASMANVLFTSYFDDVATTTYTDPITGVVTTVTPALPTTPGGAGTNQPTAIAVPTLSRWSGITIDSGAIGVINSATFRYGGGDRNYGGGTDAGTGSYDYHHALEIGGGGEDSQQYYGPLGPDGNEFFFGGGAVGAFVSITNDTFNYNADVGLNLDPQALLAADPTRPLLSGDPFIHGNVFSHNDLDGVGVAGGTGVPVNGTHSANVDYNSTWTGSDFTYILRDTIVLGPDFEGGVPVNPRFDPAYPSATGYVATPDAAVTLTLQSTLPGTVLADGTVVPGPGIPLIIKTLNNGNSPIPVETAGVSPGTNETASWAGGAGFIVGVDDGVDPPTPGEALVDDGARSQIRILGIPANQSTGQTRVPVTITSINDNSVGPVVNGNAANYVIAGNTTPAAGGDGGIIYFGGNSLTSYDLQDPRSGSIIYNADLKYLTRVEQQGGGYAYVTDQNADMSFSAQYDDPQDTLFGVPLPGATGTGDTYVTQFNSPKKLPIEDTNFSTFSDAGFVAHPGYNLLGINADFSSTSLPLNTITRESVNGEPTQTYFVNDTFSNMIHQSGRNTAIEIIGQQGDDAPNGAVAATNTAAIILNSTFYNNAIGVNSAAQAFDALNYAGGVSILVMDSIFQGQTTAAVQAAGYQPQSNLQYNLFYQNGADLAGAANSSFFNGAFNNFPYTGDPEFRNPAAGNFNLRAGSAAIDRARSEIGPLIFGTIVSPAADLTQTTQDANGNTVYYDTSFQPVRNGTGDILAFGVFNATIYPQDIITLPGLPVTTRNFPDEWVPTINVAQQGTPISAVGTDPKTTDGTVGNGYVGPDGTTGDYTNSTYAFVPIVGQRDQLGNLRVRDPNTTNTPGTGASPFIDLGAFEYLPITPPVVTAVAALSAASTVATTLYQAGGTVGTSTSPTQIQVTFNEQLNVATLTPQSVQLIGSGGDGIFGNGNDITYNLNNRLSYNASTNVLTINTTGLFPTGAALNDLYMLTLKGTGSAIIQDTSGNALDGYTAGDTLPLPSGSDDFPGSDFIVSFTIDNHPPALVPGTFGLAPGSYTTAAIAGTATTANVGSVITRNNTPTFVGTITDIFPPADPVAGDKVYIDISTNAGASFTLNEGVGTTTSSGTFSVTLNQALPDTNASVGADGILGTLDDAPPTVARVRVVDQAGNQSILATAPLSTFLAAGSATGLIIDTTDPTVTSLTPASTATLKPNAAGQIVFTANFSENINPSSLNATSILVYRAGGTGTFTGTGTPVPIVPGSIQLTYLHGPAGPVSVTFAIQATTNDLYRVVLKGTGSTPITDIAGNPLNGSGTGNTGSDYTTQPVAVFTPTNSRLIYVDNANAPTSTTQAQGTREYPFTTITAALNAALAGDTVLVLPGTYYENIALKSQVRLLSADPTSTDSYYIPGNALGTIIRGTSTANKNYNYTTGIVTVNASNLTTVPGEPTEISGFTILNPLIGNSVTGTLDTTSIGIAINNSTVTVDKNYIVNAGIGVNVNSSGTGLVGSTIDTNVIVGNYIGVQVSGLSTGVTYSNPVQIVNNTIADNTYGVADYAASAGVTQAYVLNDIFYNNHDLSAARTGTGILSLTANTLVTVSDLFYGNGVNNNASSNVSGSFGSFLNPATLSTTPNAYGNFIGDPAFVAARDPRPNGDSPPVFFLYANYDLSSRSAAINTATNAYAPATDLLYRTPVSIPGKSIAGSGPASIGAFYYNGNGGITPTYGTKFTPTTPTTVTTTGTGTTTTGTVTAAALTTGSMVGGSLPIGTQQFAVVNTSLNPDGAATGKQTIATSIAAPSSIQVNFSNNINPATINAADLILSGTGLDSTNPAHATGLTWVDSHTVKFLLAGGFQASGLVNLSIPSGSIQDTHGDSVAAYAESFVLDSHTATPASPVATTPTSTMTTTVPATSVAASAAPVKPATAVIASVSLPIQPVALAGPIAVHYTKAVSSSKSHSAKTNAATTKKAAASHAATKVEAAKHATAAKQAAPKAKAKEHKATK